MHIFLDLGLIYDVMGWLGGFFVLLAYFLIAVSTTKDRGSNRRSGLREGVNALFSALKAKAGKPSFMIICHVFNGLGALFLIINAFVHKSYPFFILNVIWLGIALKTVLSIGKEMREKKKIIK